jgi:murein DD-endopeptidase MepM/ murein hydrolase activator NlpD
MFRSTLLALAVASGAAVLATSSAPEVRPRAPAASVPRLSATAQPADRADSADGAVRARWQWPLQPRPPVLRPFRAPVTTYAAGHRGLDLATNDGAAVLAVEGGVVTHAGMVAGRGTVTVAHAGGLSSTYEPLVPVVAVGAEVAAGDVLGRVRARDGPAHCGGRGCLHLGARRGGSYLDPLSLLAGGRPALLPLG